MPKVNTKATQIIEKVRQEHDYTFEEMAEECDVAVGSIQRWYSTGRAKANKIEPLVELIENTRLPEYRIAEKLIEIYWLTRRPICITYKQLRAISGRDRLSDPIILNITVELYEHNFAFIDDLDTEGRPVYFIVRKKWLANAKRTISVDESLLEKYYLKQFEDESNEEDDF